MGISDKFDELKGKAKGKAEEMKGETKGKSAETKGKAKGKAAEAKGKAKGKAAERGDGSMVDKAASFINAKTGGKYEEHIDKATDKYKEMTKGSRDK